MRLQSKDKCWICNNIADTGEHHIKRSDLNLVFSGISNKKPIIKYSNGVREKKTINSIKSKFFHFKNKICNKCNSERTQKYDMAWERLSKYLLSDWHDIYLKKVIDLSNVFKVDISNNILFVHLYFLKIFGCMINDANTTNIDTSNFANSILNNIENENFYLAFSNTNETCEATISQITLYNNTDDDSLLYAEATYSLKNMQVTMIYCKDKSFMDCNDILTSGFKPSDIKKRIILNKDINVN